MDAESRTQLDSHGNSRSGSFRESVADALRFWERGRVLYNLILVVFGILWLVATWPHFRSVLTLIHMLQITLLALLANACYCAGYIADILLQRTSSGEFRARLRWGVWIMGMVIAIVLANYWIADEIYPFVR
jgi:cytochrome c biogenesis protein CcdA